MGDAFIPIPIRRRQGQSIYSGSVLGEARIWSSMRKTAEHALQDPVTDVCFSPQLPHELAAAHGFSVSLINPDEGSVRKTVTRFRSFAYSPHFKEDGRLMVCGCGDGSAQVFDVANRSVLRTFKGHTG